MKLSTFFAVTGLIALLFGAFFLIFPALALQQYGVPIDVYNQMQARYFGATLLQVGLVVWLSRLTQDAVAVRAILIAIIVGNACAAAISVWAGLAKLQNAMVWGSVLLYVLLLLGSAYFLLSSSRQSARGV
jgi:multisubunit Na+/H+ antiporter MnhG subunit